MITKLVLPSLLAISTLLVAPGVGRAQEPPEQSVKKALGYFLGSWTGHETGRSGVGRGERTYEMILGDQYLFANNTSTFEPQPQNPQGEVHQDWALYSYDRGRRAFIAREFHVEGFVIRLALVEHETDQRTFVFLSEAIENAPDGMRARLTWKIEGPDRFVETFELAMPGEDFEVFLTNTWSRTAA